MSNGYIVTWGGYYIQVCPGDKGWEATISQVAEGTRPGERRPRALHADTEDDLLALAQKTIDDTPRL